MSDGNRYIELLEISEVGSASNDEVPAVESNVEPGEPTTLQTNIPQSNSSSEVIYTLSRRRWLILAAYCVLTTSNLSTMFSSASISNVIQKLYAKNTIAIDWLAMIYSLASIIFMYPFSHLVSKKGLSVVMVIAAFLNSFGSCVRYVGSFHQDYGYWFFFAGNSICAIATSAFLFLPPKIAAVWFARKETATATSIAIAADSLGMAIGYVQPPLMVPNSANNEKINMHLSTYLLAVSVQSVVAFIFVCIVIKDQPCTPPSANEAAKHTNSEIISQSTGSGSFQYLKDYIILCKNCSYQPILHVHGIFFATETVWLIILNETFIIKFPGKEIVIGSMGTIGLLASMLTNFIVGILLDKARAYRKISMATTSSTFLLASCFTIAFYFGHSLAALYTIYVLITAIFTTYYTTAFDHGAELTYPVSEATSGVLLLWIAQLYSLILAQIASLINHNFDAIWVITFLLGLYLITFLVSFTIKNTGSRTSFALYEIDHQINSCSS